MKVEIYEDAAGEWRWRMKAANGRIIANGGEGFSSKHACIESFGRVRAACEDTILLVEAKNGEAA